MGCWSIYKNDNYLCKKCRGGVKYFVVEHDSEWIEFFQKGFDIGATNILQLNLLEIEVEKEDSQYTKVNIYEDFSEKLENKKFDLIIIDAPFGSDEFSRIDILPECLEEKFSFIVDDTERIGETRIVEIIQKILKERGIQTYSSIYGGENYTTIIASSKYKFLCSL